MLVIFVPTGLTVRGSTPLVYLTTTLIAVFTMSLGLLLSTKTQSSSTLTILEIAIIFPLFQFAGAAQAPELLASGGRAMARMLPWTYGNDALRRVIYLGVGFDAIAIDLLIPLVSSLVLLQIATLKTNNLESDTSAVAGELIYAEQEPQCESCWRWRDFDSTGTDPLSHHDCAHGRTFCQ